MALQLHIVALIMFAALMLTAAIEDFRRLVIPNALSIGLFAIWPIELAATPSLSHALGALACALAVFAVGALCFARGYIGGGDVKLISVATLWVGPAATPLFLAYTGLCGGVLAFALMMPFSKDLVVSGRLFLRGTVPDLTDGARTPVPYGVAIAAAALIVTLPPTFS